MKVVGEQQIETAQLQGGLGGRIMQPENIRKCQWLRGTCMTCLQPLKVRNVTGKSGQEREVAEALKARVAWGQWRAWGLWLGSTQA